MTSTYIKKQKFLLRHKQSDIQEMLPLSLQQLVQSARENCSSDLEFCLTYLKRNNQPISDFFTQNDLTPPLISITQQDLERAYYQIQAAAREVLFQEIYPKQFLKLLNQMTERVEQLSRQHPEAFKETSRSVIRGLLLAPPFKQLKVDPFRSNITFAISKYLFTFRSEIIAAALINLYFAYRNKIIRDTSLQLLASYLADSTIIHSNVLVQFFQASESPRSLVYRLFEYLKADLERLLPGWEACQPTWGEYLEKLRQVRNMACKALDGGLIYSHFQTHLEPTYKQMYSQAILDSFTVSAYRKKKTLPEYFVTALMHKLQLPLKDLFYAVWNAHFRQQAEPSSLVGLKRFIYDFMVEFVKDIPDYPQRSAENMWQALQEPQPQHNRLISQLKKARPIFQDLINQVDFHQLARRGLETFIKTTYLKPEIDGNQRIVIPDKDHIFRAIHRATPLQTFKFPPAGELALNVIIALQECLEEFLLARFQRRAEELIRPALVKKVVPNLVEVLKDPSNFVTKQPAFKNPGFSIALTDRISELDIQKKEFRLALTSSIALFPHHPHWFTFTIEDRTLHSARSKARKKTRLSAMFEASWRPLSYFLSYQKQKLYLTIQFGKEVNKLPKLSIGKREKTFKEIVIGVKLGLNNYATVSVMSVQSNYWRTPTGKIRRNVLPGKVEEYTRLFIRNTDPLTMKFGPETGTFRTDSRELRKEHQAGLTKKKEKDHLRVLLTEQRKTLAQVHSYMARSPSDYETHSTYIHAERRLSALQSKIERILALIARSVAVKISTLVQHYATAYPDQRVRVQVEDLRRSKTTSSVQQVQPSLYLSQHQVLAFYSQIQNQFVSLLRERTIGVWRVDPRQCSQVCALCGHPGQSQKKHFRCTNETHKSPQGRSYTSDAGLNIARNLALFPPLSKKPITLRCSD